MKPRYVHHCSKCTFLFTTKTKNGFQEPREVDIYLNCHNSEGMTIVPFIIRYSDEEGDYLTPTIAGFSYYFGGKI